MWTTFSVPSALARFCPQFAAAHAAQPLPYPVGNALVSDLIQATQAMANTRAPFPECHLEIKQLCCIRGERVLFRPVTFSLVSGQAVSLLGSNGSGKTSLLRSVAGLGRVDSGNIHWNSQEIRPGHANPMKQNCCYLGHKNGISTALTLKENLEFHAAIHRRTKQEAEQAAEYFGVKDKWCHRCDTLSAGQCRRAALARLLLIDRPLWLLDEPYTSLDGEGIEKVDALIHNHLQQGGMAIIATHQEICLNSSSHDRIRLQAL